LQLKKGGAKKKGELIFRLTPAIKKMLRVLLSKKRKKRGVKREERAGGGEKKEKPKDRAGRL